MKLRIDPYLSVKGKSKTDSADPITYIDISLLPIVEICKSKISSYFPAAKCYKLHLGWLIFHIEIRFRIN